jgi:uncharacterized SAM-binding protein YcdF (DUF218 family)
MFLAAKLLAFVTQPIAWALILLGLGLLALAWRRKWGLRLCWAAFAVLALVGWQLPVETVMRRLETRYPAPDFEAPLPQYVGIVLLGGAVERSELWARKGQIALNGQAERLTVSVSLMQRNPQLKLLYTGGEGDYAKKKFTEADRAKIFFDSLGVDPKRVIYEAESRTTYDNGVMSARVPGVDIKQPWLLLTTAAHMPRSMAVFQKAGWNVTPYCVDYRTADTTDWGAYSFTGGADKWHYTLHEVIGYWAYWLAGKI